MTREELERLRGLHAEIRQLKAMRPRNREVVIFYKDYRTGKGIPKTDVGMDDGSNEAEELRKAIEKTERKAMKQATEAEIWLDEVKDPTMRVILRGYYVEGKTQGEIADELGYSREWVKKKIHFFWANQ